MKGTTGIVIGIPIGATIGILAWMAWHPIKPFSLVPSRAEDSLRIDTRARTEVKALYHDSSFYFQSIRDSIHSIPPQVIIDDEVRGSRSASVDTVQDGLLASPTL